MDDTDDRSLREGPQGAVPQPEGGREHRILVVGANGPTGREVVAQALVRGHHVRALTRHPEDFPLKHTRLQVLAGDATDPVTVDAAVRDVEAVVCCIGAKFTRHPVEVYSMTAHLLVVAMLQHRARRLVVVTSSGVAPSEHRRGVVDNVSYNLMRRTFARTVYDDMVRMERYVSASPLDWTIVRPPGLVSQPGRGYEAAEGEIDGSLCARADLAAMLLDQLDDDRFINRIAAITTHGLSVSALEMLRSEVLKR